MRLLIFSIILWSFAAGIVHHRWTHEPEFTRILQYDHTQTPQVSLHDKTVEPIDIDDYEVTETSVESVAQYNVNEKLFVEGENVTCIYQGVFSWDNGDQFVKGVSMKCKVLQASEEYKNLGPNYQHIQVDCSKDLEFKSSDRPGAGMVKDHPLNFKTRWYSSSDCYHFQEGQ